MIEMFFQILENLGQALFYYKWIWTALLFVNSAVLLVFIFITNDRTEIKQATTYPIWKPLAKKSRFQFNVLYLLFLFQLILVIIQTKFILD
jgi:hypothetical protein